MPPRPARPLLVAAAAVLLAACGHAGPGGGSPPPTGPPPGQAAPPPPANGVVAVAMNDQFRFEPAAIVVEAGQTVTFAVTNRGRLEHEFVLGDRAVQAAHEQSMQAPAGSHAHDGGGAHGHRDGNGSWASVSVDVAPGQTKRLAWTFRRPGVVIYGCHVTGHYGRGMRGTVTVLAGLPAGRP
jgi:uncharacterized cupredoxin-like copper-binding protein